MNANAVYRLGLCGAGELRTPDPLTDTPLEGEPMTKPTRLRNNDGRMKRQAHEKTFAYSIGPAVDLAELDTQFRAWLKTPWRDDEIMQPEQTR